MNGQPPQARSLETQKSGHNSGAASEQSQIGAFKFNALLAQIRLDTNCQWIQNRAPGFRAGILPTKRPRTSHVTGHQLGRYVRIRPTPPDIDFCVGTSSFDLLFFTGFVCRIVKRGISYGNT